MARLLISAVAALLGVCTVALCDAHAVAERRVALVIGNSDYKNASLSLTNPKNDASAIAAVLRSLDFEVQLVTDVGKRDMDGILERFARLSTNADSALFYYAGHAIQYHGKNYLMPVDAELQDEISVRYNLVSVDDARAALDRVSGVKIMILDACRDNPIAERLNHMAYDGQTRSAVTTRGLARIDKTQGMVVAYATAADDVALDGNNSVNSPFTTALIKEMQEPGLEIGTMFRRVARDVNDATGGRQRPETSISLLSEYYLNQSDRKIWEGMRETADIPQILEFLRRYPNSISSLDAKSRLDVLERIKRDRDDEEARVQREAYKKKLEAEEAALEERRKEGQQAAVERAAQQQRDEQRRLAKLAADRQNAAKLLAEKEESDQRRQLAEKLAALEQERDKAQQEVAAREEARRKEEEARQEAARQQIEEAKRQAIADAQLQVEQARRAAKEEAEKLAADRQNAAKLLAEKEESDQRRQLAEKLAALEQERDKAQQEVAAREEARRKEEEARQEAARQQLEEAKRQAIADAQLQVEQARRAAKEEAEKLAALAPTQPVPQSPPPSPALKDPADIARLLQAHLKRVGCNPGTTDGNWDDGSKKALELFNKNARTNFDIKLASLDALDAVRGKTDRVCPLTCAKGQRIEGDRCIQIGCSDGFFLNSSGTCEKRPEPAPRPRTAARHEPATIRHPAASGGAKCFSFNGKSYCE